jgi:hypothetical protein
MSRPVADGHVNPIKTLFRFMTVVDGHVNSINSNAETTAADHDLFHLHARPAPTRLQMPQRLGAVALAAPPRRMRRLG